MGLIKAALGSVNQVIGDQFKEFITCPEVSNDVVIQRGVVSHGDANRTYTEGVITNGSGIVVPNGMAMMIVDNGKIVEFTAEDGTYTYDTSSEPSIFTGGFGNGLLESIKTIGSRITYGGQAAKDQRVYYVNTKLIPGLTYGSQQPVMIKDPIYQSVRVTYNGMYAVKVVDPAILIANLVGSNPKDTLTLNDIFTSEGNTSMLKQQFAQNVGQAISQLMTQKNVSFVEIQKKTD
jgi:membrane protease subunit (stomatin/prohibitin family)